MPVCQTCGHTWSLGETLKRSFSIWPAMKCPNCERDQFITAKSRKRSAIVSGLSIALVMLFKIFFGPTAYTFVLFGLVLLVVMITYLRMIKLSNTEEHMF